MTTRADVIQRVGEDLSIVPIGQDLENQDQARIGAAYDEVYLRLKDKGLAAWASTDDVPTKLTPYVCLMIEEKLLTTYSVPDARYQRIKTDAGMNGDLAVNAISEITTPMYESTTSEEDF